MHVPQVVYLVASQVATKAVTFGSNQVLLRRISPEIFGIAAYLEFLVNSVLFFSREAVRIANQRAKSENAVVKFAYLPIFLCGPITIVLLFLQTYSDLYKHTVAHLPYLGATMSLIIASIALELLAEPLFAVNQYKMNFKLRSKVESLAVFVKCLTVFAAVTIWQNSDRKSDAKSALFDGHAVLSFACGQFMYSAVIFLGYWRGTSKLPMSNSQTTHFLDSGLYSIWKSLFLQMVFKHFLTEGDTMLVSYLFTVTEQGVYSVIANYGSMVARLLFQPIEESLRVSFTRDLAAKTPDYKRLNRVMDQLMFFYFNLSLLIVVGGYANGSFLLRMILGRSEKWAQSSVFDDFSFYVLYIPFMAFNGVLEAFFSSASSQAQIGNFSIFMSSSSVMVFLLMYILIGKLDMGIRGLIVANMANMLLRIVYCLKFYVEFFKNYVRVSFSAVLRKSVVPLVCATVALIAQNIFFKNGKSATLTEFVQSLGICFFCLCAMVVNGRDQISAAASLFRHSSKGKPE
ncbi:hypothetical protein OXX79_003191 [Metschnikowia pulcherrima]